MAIKHGFVSEKADEEDTALVRPSDWNAEHVGLPEAESPEGKFLRDDGSWQTVSGGEAFPIGSVFLAVVNTNPATLLGYGTWSQIASGKFLVGQDGGDADFDIAEETGGKKTHTLTVNEMPSHNHSAYITRSATTGSDITQVARSQDTSSTRMDTPTEVEGGGQAHNNLPPYFVVYIWKRTA